MTFIKKHAKLENNFIPQKTIQHIKDAQNYK